MSDPEFEEEVDEVEDDKIVGEDKFQDAALILRYEALNVSTGDERLKPNFDNNAYKVCYRLLSNMMYRWDEDLQLDRFPTEDDAINISIQVDPYFVKLFGDRNELEKFKTLYDFLSDSFNGME